jgi:hypothetical protein
MQEHTTSETIEWKTTTYSCDVDGCDFTTQDKREAERHPGKAHSIAEVGHAADHTFYRFDSKESFDAYVKASHIGDRDLHWDEPGWYRVYTEWRPCPRGCCRDDYRVIEPACWIAFEWQREIKKRREKLAEMAEFLNDETLLEID